MNNLEQIEASKDKLKKICDVIRSETLDPVKEEARIIIQKAKEDAARIVEEGKLEVESMKAGARKELEKERKLFDNSLSQASKQTVTILQQEIENKLFNEELNRWLIDATTDPKMASKLIEVLVQAIEKEGISADFSAVIAKSIPPENINRILAASVRDKLREKAVVLGDFKGGIQIVLHDNRITLDLSEEALKELLAKYLRKDFQKHLFAMNT